MSKLTLKANPAVVAVLLLVLLWPAAARSEEAWLAVFEQTCSKTSEAMTLSVAELNALIEKCGELQKIIETQDESTRKVYLKRLQMCRNLYAYMLEHKKGGQASK